MKNSLLIIFLFLITGSVCGQTYYYNSGDPTLLSNWGDNPGGSGNNPPSFSNAGFVIEQGKTATVNSLWFISFAQLAVNPGATLIANSAITLSATSTFKLDSAGTYIHNNTEQTFTTIFAGNEDFHPNSNVRIDNWFSTSFGMNAGVTYNAAQYYYGNLEINWTSCVGDWAMGLGNIVLCANDFRVTSTGKGRLISGAIFNTMTITVKNYYQTGGEVDLSFGSTIVNGYALILSIRGNFEKTGGVLDGNGASSFGRLYFTRGQLGIPNDTVHQTFYNSGTLRRVQIRLASNTKMRLLGNMPLTTNNSLCGFSNESQTVLDCGTYQVTGAGPFDLGFVSTLKLGSPSGFKSGSSSGNIITTGTKTIHSSNTIEYCGTTAQVLGDSIPNPFPCILKINNSQGVSLDKTMRLANPVQFSDGTLNLGNYDLIAPNNLVVNGKNANNFFNTNGTGYYKIYVTGGGQYDFYVGSRTFSPLRMQFISASPDTFSVRVTDGFVPGALPPDSNYCVKKTWHIVDKNPGNASVFFFLQWMQTDNGISYNHSNQNLIARYESGISKYVPMFANQGINFVNPPAYPSSAVSYLNGVYPGNFTEDSYIIIGNNNGVYDTYYFDAGDASLLTSWKKNQDGSGSSPSSFDEYATFNVGLNKVAVFDSPVTFSNKTKLRLHANSTVTANQPITNLGGFDWLDSSTYNHNNNGIAASTIFAGIEQISERSNYNILMWSDTAHKIYDNVSGTFGNLTINFNNISAPFGGKWSGNYRHDLCAGNFKYLQSSRFHFAPVGNGYFSSECVVGGNIQIGDSTNPGVNPVLDIAAGTLKSADSSAGILTIRGNLDIQAGGIISQDFPVVAKGRIQFYSNRKHTFYCYRPFHWQTYNLGNANYPNYVPLNDTLVLKSDFYNAQNIPFLFHDMWQVDGVMNLDTFSIRSTNVKVGSTGIMVTRKQEGFYADLANVQSVILEPGATLEYAGNETQNFRKNGSYVLTNIPNLKINNPYNVNLNVPNINITDAIMLENGKLICDSVNYLTLHDTTEMLGGNSNSFISGVVAITTNSMQWKIIPFGKNDNYRKVVILPNDVSQTTWYIRYFDAEQSYGDSIGTGINSISTSEYFIIDRISGFAPAQVGIPWGPNSGVTNPGTLRAARWNGLYWEDSGNNGYVGTSDSGFVISNSLNFFSPFVIASPEEQPLPVELQSFSSLVVKNEVILDWTTSQEINNTGFDVERKSANDSIWGKIAFVQGAGNSNQIKNYKYEDKNLTNGKYNYRLKQIDFNGNFNYFTLDNEIEVGVPKNFALSQNYPNPFNPSTKISFELPKDSKVSLQIFDITGRMIASLVNNENYTAGYYTVQFNAGALASGTYFFRMVAGDFVQTKKMQLIK